MNEIDFKRISNSMNNSRTRETTIKKLSNKDLLDMINSTLDKELLYDLEEEYINRQVGYVPQEEFDDESM